MSSFDIEIQAEDLSALEAYEASLYQATQDELMDQWFEDVIEDVNVELQCVAEVNR
jgi:hypothetical protein